MRDTLKKAVEYHRRGMVNEAEPLYLEVARQHPGHAPVHQALSQICYQQGRLAESIAHLQRARDIVPGDAGIRFSLGALYAEHGQLGEAIENYTASLSFQPNNDDAWSNLGMVHYELLNFSAAVECLGRALKINDRNEKALFNLGLSLIAAGQSEQADRMLRAAHELSPDNNAISSCLLFNLHNLATLTSKEIFDQHRQWGSRFDAFSLAGARPARPLRHGRRIRVGYVSPDFRRHSVFYFINPVLKAHDRTRIECFGYSDVLRPDDATRQLMDTADHWRDISRFGDEQVLQLIREDEIDILVDLAGHTARNRLTVFGKRATPIQVSWLGYPDTTGLRVMDYRLTDARADPPGESDAFHTEALVRLEQGFLCYEPPVNSPAPDELPARKNGFVTFGSFNNLAKVTDEVVQAWSDILHRLKDARMILKAKGLGDATSRAGILSRFQSHGIDAGRIECLGAVAGVEDHLDVYRRIDIALDTFPYGGTTTTCEALWMGVPVITLEGDRHVSRVGASLLATVGLTDCIASGEDAYIERAVVLAGNARRLDDLRAGLRGQMCASPLMDAPGFTRILESHYCRFLDQLESA